MGRSKNQSSVPAPASDGAAPAKRTRTPRNNHDAAEKYPITDTASAQAFIDAQLADTAGDDKEQANFNSSGFTTPSILNRQTPENLTRMGVAILSALASQTGGENADAAGLGLTVLGQYATESANLQIASSKFQTLLTAARTLYPDFSGTDEELVDQMLSNTSQTTWAEMRQSILSA